MRPKTADPKDDLPKGWEDEPFRQPTEAEWAEVDAWTERNKDALNASIRRAREEFARGECYSLDEVMAHIESDRKERARGR